ncbi:MAG: 16S rRNA (uracil(1498)-N(3))-methyltransferase [Desulfobacterales bacterium]|nr:16S rRNA (uracil(1498)-N(3))-methyltransferase [Desulfobacterales bacterium]
MLNRRFFIDEKIVSCLNPVIEGSDARHIKTVLRLKEGDEIELFDGKGFSYDAKILSVKDDKISLSIIEKIKILSESNAHIILAQSMLKENKMDDIIRQITEIGVFEFIPFLSERSISKPDNIRFSARIKRWKKIAKEAVKQCRRSFLPNIYEIMTFDEVISYSKDLDLKIIFWEKESSPICKELLLYKDKMKIIIVLGPEGGFTEEEVDKAKQYGFYSSSLGPRILRSETAAITACSIIQYVYGDMGNNY